MDDKIETVAMAIAFARDGSKPETYTQFADMIKDDLRRQARAAIAAMREPTAVMIASGDGGRKAGNSKWGNTRGTWIAMVDAALTP